MDRIDKENIENIFPLTHIQAGMLFHYLANPTGDTYFEQLCLQLHGSIDADIFKKAWNCVVETNEMLRTVFRWQKMKNPVQLVLKRHEPDIRFVSHEGEKLNKKFFRGAGPRRGRPLNHTLGNQKVRNGDRQEKFDLQEVPFRVALCKLAEDRYEMIISNHHILYDGWSNGIILREFFAAYAHLSAGEIYVKPQKTGYKEYIRWLHDQDRTRQKHFWQDYLAGLAAPTVLPIKRPQGKAAPSTGSFKTQLSKSSSLELEHFAREGKITLAAMFYSAYGILLQKYNNSADVVFGTTTAGRPAQIKGIEEMVGLFIDTPPLRVQVFPGETAAALLKRIDADMKRREEYEAAPLVQIKEYSPISGSTELFDSIMVIENYPLPTGQVHPQAGLVMTGYDMVEMTNYDLTIAVMLLETGSRLNFIYNSLVLEEETVGRLCGHFVNILQEIKENPARQIGEIEMLSAAEKQQILVDFNRREEEYAADKTIRQLFMDQVERTPDGTAVVGERVEGRGGDETLTYRKLAAEANLVARYLSGKGLSGNDLTGIMVDRGLEMITGILGILLTGSGYVPLNPRAPAIHSKYIMDECRVAILLTAHEITEIASKGKDRPKFDACSYIEDITGEEEEAHAAAEQREMPANTNAPAAGIAYIIFTSGSTGKPKGVPVAHSNFCALLHWGYHNMQLNAADRVVQNLSYYFDWSVWEIFITLTSGAGLVLVKKETMLDAEAYIDFMNTHRITALHITPTQFQTLTHTNRRLTSMRHLAIGAEKLTFDLVQRAFGIVKETCRVYNMYGPTEATIMAAVLEIERDKEDFYTKLASIPIGPPIANNDFYILDRNFNVTPIYAAGELYIAGAGAALGYLNNPESTVERFVFNNRSYKSYRTYSFKKMYRTGDLARWLPDGTVEYVGRIDQQVKIRGFRIEPGEIENRLLEHGNIKEAVVLARQYKNGENYLCAYIVPNHKAPTSRELREYLSQTLPDYMIPTYFVEIGQIPLNANGKVDREKLPEFNVSLNEKQVILPPNNGIERKLLSIWSEVLGIEEKYISVDDNFFKIGGHSLKATAIMTRIHKELDASVGLMEILKTPTIRQIAGLIEAIVWVKEQEVEDDFFRPIDKAKRVKEVII